MRPKASPSPATSRFQQPHKIATIMKKHIIAHVRDTISRLFRLHDIKARENDIYYNTFYYQYLLKSVHLLSKQKRNISLPSARWWCHYQLSIRNIENFLKLKLIIISSLYCAKQKNIKKPENRVQKCTYVCTCMNVCMYVCIYTYI